MAAELAHKASLRHLDTDRMIEASTGASVADLFAAEGEEAFRSLEFVALKEALASKERVVISTGGGIVTHDDARMLLEAHAPVVFLDVSVPVALERIGENAHERPLLGEDPFFSLTVLDRHRRLFYERVADLTMNVDEKSVEEIADQILERVGSSS